MEAETEEREVQSQGDMRELESKHKKRKTPNSRNENKEQEKYVVGMVSESRKNGLFSDPHKVGESLVKTVGDINSVRITRSGMVIIECKTKQQMKQVLKIDEWNKADVKCFRLGSTRKRGVISGVSRDIYDYSFEEIEGVCGVRRMMRFRDGKKEESESICLTFEGELPEKVYHEFVCYRVRPFEVAPLRCYCCQDYGHVAAVCRAEKRCGNCGKTECKERKCEKEQSKPKCLHCAGEHHVGSVKCPRKIREVKVNQIRKQGAMSYSDAVKKLEGKESATEHSGAEERRSRDGHNICLDKRGFLAFIAMVINCAVEIPRKSERIKMVLDAARRFLNVVEITGEELDDMLREGFTPTQA